MAKFKVEYSGFVYVEADNEEDVKEMYDYGETVYEENKIDKVIEVDEFIVEL